MPERITVRLSGGFLVIGQVESDEGTAAFLTSLNTGKQTVVPGTRTWVNPAQVCATSVGGPK